MAEKDKPATPAHSNMDIPNPVPVTPQKPITPPELPNTGIKNQQKSKWWDGEWSTLEESVRAAAREEFQKLMEAMPEGKPYYVVRDADVKQLIETLALGPWQKDMLTMWLDHLETWRKTDERTD